MNSLRNSGLRQKLSEKWRRPRHPPRPRKNPKCWRGPAMERVVSRAHKHRASILHVKALIALQRHGKPGRTGLIAFPAARQALSWILHLNKAEAKAVLRELADQGLISHHPFNGIRLLLCSGLYVQGDRGEQQPRGKCLHCLKFNREIGTFTRCIPVIKESGGPVHNLTGKAR